MSSSPIITVKKADGSYIKVPMDEFVPEKKDMSLPEAQREVKKNEQIGGAVFEKKSPHLINGKNDFTSLLDEQLPDSVDKNAPLTSVVRTSQVDEVIKKLSFKIDSAQENRFRSALQLRLKEIRSEDETRSTLTRPTKDGGLELSAEQTEEVLKKCLDFLLPQVIVSELPSVVHKNNTTPRTAPKPLSSTSATFPVNSIPKTKQPPITDMSKEYFPTRSSVPSPRHNTVRPLVRDIVAKPAEFGPLEEIHYMTLLDFRRLAPNPDEAADRFGQKLLNLKAESVVLFLQAVDAWKKSSLYNAYISAVIGALASRKKMVELKSVKEEIQIGEINALVKMENQLL
jgi:hypothetical protein